MILNLDTIKIERPSDSIDAEQLQGIVDSIKEVGLSHRPIVRPANNLAGAYYLVSGEKRILAARALGWTEMDVEVRDVSETDGQIIRLHENLRRFNLPWHEQVILVEQLHLLRQSEHGVATRGRPEKDTPKVGWTVRDTANELQMGVGNLSEDLNLAKALHMDRALANVKDKKTAIKLVRNAVRRNISEEEAGLPSNTSELDNQVLFGDSVSILKQMAASSIDHCITDPPWINFFDAKLTLDERTLPVFTELYRVLKYNSFLYIFCGLDDYDYYVGHDEPDPANPSGERIHVKGQLEKIGFNVANTPIIWQKVNSLSRRGVRTWEYDRDFEFVIVAAKGSPVLTASRRLSGIKSFKIVHPSQMIHANEKPVELVEDLLADCSYDGNLIIDPFAGSGVLGLACKRSKRKFVLIERDKAAYDAIVKRMEAK